MGSSGDGRRPEMLGSDRGLGKFTDMELVFGNLGWFVIKMRYVSGLGAFGKVRKHIFKFIQREGLFLVIFFLLLFLRNLLHVEYIF